ncbi:MAG: hypothetical protein KDD50_12250 [Bdellovibrionales bacterium]|nr:hypothetical protein [Bdellovibrionales bacterium]
MNLLIMLVLLVGVSSYAATKKKTIVSVNSIYNSIQDIKLGNSTTSSQEQFSLSVELGFRFFRTHQLIIASTQTTDNLRSDIGLGLRFDLPGFFYIGSTAKDLQLQKKSYPVNTSGYFHTGISDVNESGVIVKAGYTQWGFTMDIFLFNKITYLTTNASVYSVQGNSYFVSGVGLGAEF